MKQDSTIGEAYKTGVNGAGGDVRFAPPARARRTSPRDWGRSIVATVSGWLGRRKRTPDITDNALAVSLTAPGCPVCVELTRMTRNYFFWLFNENHTDPWVLAHFAQAHGFCNLHAEEALNYVNASSAVTYMYEYIADAVGRRLGQVAGHRKFYAQRGVGPLHPRRCPACESLDGSAEHTAWSMAKLLRDSGLLSRYGHPTTLCFPHLQRFLPHLASEELDRVLRIHYEKLRFAVTALPPHGTRDVSPATADAVRSALRLVTGNDHRRSARSLPDLPAPVRPDPLADFAELLGRTDACPVCLEVARAQREWIGWLAQAAPHKSEIEDLLPACARHIALCVDTSVPELVLAIAHRAVNGAARQIDFALKALHPPIPSGRATERSRGWLRDMRATRRSEAIMIAARSLPCHVCDRITVARDRALELLLALLKQSHHRARYEVGHGLCMKHLIGVLARPGLGATYDFLVQTQVAKLACLRWELGEQSRKGAWFARPEAGGAEQTAWLRALTRFSGLVDA